MYIFKDSTAECKTRVISAARIKIHYFWSVKKNSSCYNPKFVEFCMSGNFFNKKIVLSDILGAYMI